MKLKTVWKLQNGKSVTIDINGKHENTCLFLSKKALTDLALKILYWNLNCYSGEGWGNAVCFLKQNFSLRKIEDIVVGDCAFSANFCSIADFATKDCRCIEVNN